MRVKPVLRVRMFYLVLCLARIRPAHRRSPARRCTPHSEVVYTHRALGGGWSPDCLPCPKRGLPSVRLRRPDVCCSLSGRRQNGCTRHFRKRIAGIVLSPGTWRLSGSFTCKGHSKTTRGERQFSLTCGVGPWSAGVIGAKPLPGRDRARSRTDGPGRKGGRQDTASKSKAEPGQRPGYCPASPGGMTE